MGEERGVKAELLAVSRPIYTPPKSKPCPGTSFSPQTWRLQISICRFTRVVWVQKLLLALCLGLREPYLVLGFQLDLGLPSMPHARQMPACSISSGPDLLIPEAPSEQSRAVHGPRLALLKQNICVFPLYHSVGHSC